MVEYYGTPKPQHVSMMVHFFCNKDHFYSNKERFLNDEDHFQSDKECFLNDKDNFYSDEERFFNDKDQVYSEKHHFLNDEGTKCLNEGRKQFHHGAIVLNNDAKVHEEYFSLEGRF